MSTSALSAIEFHVLLVLVEEDQYGYAIMKAVEEQSGGRFSPEVGHLYRILARLLEAGLVEETDGPDDPGVHPGRKRKYYRLTAAGRAEASEEAARLREVLGLASTRDLLADHGA